MRLRSNCIDAPNGSMWAPVGAATPPGSLTGSPLALCAMPATRETLGNTLSTVNSVVCLLGDLDFCMLADMGKLDPDDSRPPYQQIADHFAADIESGELAPGAQLPALPVITSEYGVSPGTARSALATLREAGLVVTRHGKGTFVRTHRPSSDEEPAPSAAAFEELQKTVEALSERLDLIEKRIADHS